MTKIIIAASAAFIALAAPAIANDRGASPTENAMTRSETLAIAAGGTAATDVLRGRAIQRVNPAYMEQDAFSASSNERPTGGDR
jgi:hypothetical protein